MPKGEWTQWLITWFMKLPRTELPEANSISRSAARCCECVGPGHRRPCGSSQGHIFMRAFFEDFSYPGPGGNDRNHSSNIGHQAVGGKINGHRWHRTSSSHARAYPSASHLRTLADPSHNSHHPNMKTSASDMGNIRFSGLSKAGWAWVYCSN